MLAALLFSVSAFASSPKELIPGGNTIGLHMQTEGVSIVELTDAIPKEAGLKKGDVICKVDEKPVQSAKDLKEIIQNCQGAPVTLCVLRKGERSHCTLAPKKSGDSWALGILVRDSITGIGTLTYYNAQNGSFGALGHGVSDECSLLPLRTGEVLPSGVKEVIKGEKGKPGALQGEVLGRESSGQILQNTPQGIFGSIAPIRGKALPVADWEEIRPGEAVILSNVRGTEVEEYTVEILKICPKDEKDRNLILKVTDPDLLAATGGIVQGMSGSPLVQDGKLIGAVTHVLVNDPTMGYGIFIENMLEAAG